MAQQLGGQPLIVLAGGAQRTSGRDAQSMNITAGKAVAEAIRTTLGPRGMDKMLVDSSGTVVVNNDGATILAEMDIDLKKKHGHRGQAFCLLEPGLKDLIGLS